MAAMQERVRFVVRPITKAGYEDLFNESALIKNRHALSGHSPGDAWRHGWLYDVGSDMEHTTGEKAK